MAIQLMSFQQLPAFFCHSGKEAILHLNHPPTDIQAGTVHHFPSFKKTDIGSSPTDIQIGNHLSRFTGKSCGTRAFSSQDRFQVWSCRRYHKAPGNRREGVCYLLCISFFHAFSSDDDSTGRYIRRPNSGRKIFLFQDMANGIAIHCIFV